MSKFPEAIASFNACLDAEELQENHLLHAYILNQLGYIYRRQGELSETIHFYNLSLTVQRGLDNQQEYANTLNSLGNVYRQQGKIEEALQHCKISLRIRRELFQAGKLSELYIALTQSTIGQIYIDRDDIIRSRDDVTRAERCFQEALDIYNRVGYKRGIAATYNRLGQVQMAREHWDEAMRLFKMAYSASLDIDVETRIISLNKQGRVLVHQEKWEEAADLFRHAIELAQQANYSYEEAESLIDLAETLKHLRASIDQVLKEAIQISFKHDYHYLLAHAEDIQGDAAYKAREYQKAFKHYRVACRYLALNSRLRYEKRLRDLLDALLDMPSTHLPGVVDLLTSYWYDHKLDTNYSELLDICRAISKHIVL